MPQPAKGEVRVRVLAAGVSGFDLIYRRWTWLPGAPPVPFTLGVDIAGIVDAVGAEAKAPEPGSLVVAATWTHEIGGGSAEYVCVPADQPVPVPSGIDPAQAVALVANYLTAHQHLHQYGQVRHGERLLVHGAAGGVGSATLDLAQLEELEVHGTASTDNQEVVRSRGATPIDYRTEDFATRLE